MRGRVWITLILMAVPGTGLASESQGDDYLAVWEGNQFYEKSNPLERFRHFPVADDDGDGLSNISLTPLQSIPRVFNDPAESTLNAAIAARLSDRGVTHEAVAGIIFEAGKGHLTNIELAKITDYIQRGDFTGGAALAETTVLEITFFCGNREDPREVPWIIGVPTIVDCDRDVVPDLAFTAVPLMVGPSVSNNVINPFSTLWIDVQSELLNPLYNGRVQAFGYRAGEGPHVVAIETIAQPFLEVRLSFSGLYSTLVDVKAEINGLLPFRRGDAVSYTHGLLPFAGTTVSLDVARDQMQLLVNLYTNLNGGLQVTVELPNPLNFDFLRAEILLPNGERLPIESKGFPSKFTVAFRETSTPSLTKYHVYLQSPLGAVVDMEVKGTYYDDESEAEFSFQLVGFPQRNILKLTLGTGDRECGTGSIFSLDLSKNSPHSAGRYRAIAVTGHSCNKEMSVLGSNLHRMKIVSAKDDAWDDDGDVLLMIGATTNVQHDSRMLLDVNVPWLPDALSRMENITSTDSRWLSLIGVDYRQGLVPRGLFVKDDGLLANAYFWNIAESQLDQDTSCIFRIGGSCV